MTCEQQRRALALYVEGDLESDLVRRLEVHLGSCAECRAFLAALRESQLAVKDLAGVTVDEGAVRAVSERVAEELRRGPWPRVPLLSRGRWALAACLAMAVVGVVAWRASHARREPPGRLAPLAPAPVVARREERAPVAPAAPAQRPRRRAAEAQPTGPRDDGPGPEVALGPEDADQLARAVVAVSRIERLRDLPDEDVRPASPQQTQLIQLATEDPNVVIYWQIESNGG